LASGLCRISGGDASPILGVSYVDLPAPDTPSALALSASQHTLKLLSCTLKGFQRDRENPERSSLRLRIATSCGGKLLALSPERIPSGNAVVW
jgi:hypothetical protein